MATIYGTGKNDALNGTNGDDAIIGYAYTWSDGESGDDTLRGGAGNDTLDGDGHPSMDGGSDDLLDGGAGNDFLYSGGGFDTLDGGAGDDRLETSYGGADRLDGGAGDDLAVIDRSGAAADLRFALLDPATVTTLAGDGTTVVNVETIHIRTGDGDDRITTGDGDDRIDGGGGGDLLRGGVGRDTLDGGTGRDTLDGGAGIDTAVITLSGVTTDLSFVMRGAGQRFTVPESGTTLIGIEAVALGSGAGDDRLVGNVGDDWFNGGAGRDTVAGRDGADTLIGGEGDDRLDGGNGDDVFHGGDGRDWMLGGAGNDVLSDMDYLSASDDSLFGGAGDDVLSGGLGRDRFEGGTGNDLLVSGWHGDGFYDDYSRDVLVFRGDFGSDEVRGFTDGHDRLVFVGFGEDDISVVQSEDNVSIRVESGADVHWVTLNSFQGTFDHDDYTVL